MNNSIAHFWITLEYVHANGICLVTHDCVGDSTHWYMYVFTFKIFHMQSYNLHPWFASGNKAEVT